MVNIDSSTQQEEHDHTLEEDDTDALFDELENDTYDFSGLREQRMEELKRDLERTRAQDEVHGRYTELTEEKDVIQTSAKEPLCVIHFYHRDFRRCKIMDSHLEALAPNYPGTRFLRVLVENVPFLVDRLQIKVLPCVVCFVKGVTKDRLVGFEQLGNADEFETGVLELRLKQSGVIEDAPRVPLRTRYSEPERRSGIRNSCLGDEDDDPYA